eukprot:TRINITY_DN1231_c0_g1_i1.p1 TRINITY_DN1231_c0_g1~~TRINITY_DN1231_c0_g1_i1.p1  ORF type:complete len:640 (-),score=181.11 TRINITY_DN1231_c0_g1_i1:170-2089(-)
MEEREYFRLNDRYDSPNFPLETSRSFQVENLDQFLTNAYHYFLGKGFSCIVIAKFLNLLSLLWVISLVTFLLTCVDYSVLYDKLDLESSIIYGGIHPFLAICIGIFFFYWMYQLRSFISEMKRMWNMKKFYNRELNISEEEIHTVEWNEVVSALTKVPRLCISMDRMTHLDIANRIMRKENYLIALINKEILNLEIPFLPFVSKTQVVTKTLEWGLSLTIFNFIFENDILNRQILDNHRSHQMIKALRKRFVLMGFIGFIISPFLFVFLIVYFIFKYGEEVHSKPGTFALRQWSPLARWKFRELNELPHIFQKRLNVSKNLAEKYVTSFNVDILTILARFVSFVIGSLVVVVVILGLTHDGLILKVQIHKDISVFWFVTVATSVLALCRSLIPDPSTSVEPHKIMEEMVQHTHYMPKSWRGKTHTKKVLLEFNQLYQYRILVFLTEVLSVLFAPLILIFSLPKSSENIIQFFRDYTITENGVGDVCKFAMFPLEELGSRTYGVDSNSSKRQRTKQGKMEKSFLNFKANYPEWQPDAQGEKYLASVAAAMSGFEGGSAPASLLNPSTREDPFLLGRSVRSQPNSVDSSAYSMGSLGESYLSDPSIVLSDRQILESSLLSLQKIHKRFGCGDIHYKLNDKL